MVKKNGLKYNSYFPLLLFMFAALVWRSPYYVFSLYVAIPILIVYCFYNYNRIILSTKYFRPYLFIIVWMLLSSIINPNSVESIRMMVPIIASFLLSMSSYAITYSNKNSRILYFSYVALFFYLMIVNIQSGGFTTDFDYANEIERRDNTVLNANVYAYYSLFAIISWRMYLQKVEKRVNTLVLAFIYLLSAGVSFYVAMMTASRQVLALQIPLLLFFFYIDFIKGRGQKKLVALLVIMVLIVVFPMVMDLYDNSYLSQRSQIGFQEDNRWQLLSRAVEQGMDNPIFGLGIGANTFYSHCTYTHLLARSGFPVFVVFVVIMLKSLIEQCRRYLKTKNSSFLLYLGGLGVIAVGHFTYSYFQEPFMMAIMFAIIGCSDKDYKILKIMSDSINEENLQYVQQ